MNNKFIVAAVPTTLLGIALIIGVPKAIDAYSFTKSIEIKDISIGMTEKEVANKIGKIEEFTIAGVNPKRSSAPLTLYYYEGKLDGIYFFFESIEFDTVLEAVKNKYPSLKCVESTTNNAMGMSFNETECTLKDSESTTLTMLRRDENISTSSLIIVSKRNLAEWNERQNNKKNDI
ncbi:MAG: hypothetical protein ACXW0Q_07125 [Methylovulum sp.]